MEVVLFCNQVLMSTGSPLTHRSFPRSSQDCMRESMMASQKVAVAWNNGPNSRIMVSCSQVLFFAGGCLGKSRAERLSVS